MVAVGNPAERLDVASKQVEIASTDEQVDRYLAELGTRVRAAREDREWSTAELARRSGCSQSFVSELENGKAGKPNLMYVHSLSAALGIPIQRLLPPPVGAESRESVVPVKLQELVEDGLLDRHDAITLASMSFRGAQPRTRRDWELLAQVWRFQGERRAKPDE